METHTKHFIRAFVMAIVGMALTATLIGAIIGIPLILLAAGYYGLGIEEKHGEKPWWLQGWSSPGDDRPWWSKSFVTLWKERKQRKQD